VIDFSLRVEAEMELVNQAAGWYCKGGKSSYQREDRNGNRFSDQQRGIMGELAYHVYHFGTEDGFFEHKRDTRHDGTDRGMDVPGLWLDVKTSTIPELGAIQGYNLLVSKDEHKPATTYVQACVLWHSETCADVHLVGWAVGDELRLGMHKGDEKWIRPIRRLHRLPPHRWEALAPAKETA
jgi:hypothetical protein